MFNLEIYEWQINKQIIRKAFNKDSKDSSKLEGILDTKVYNAINSKDEQIDCGEEEVDKREEE